MTKKGNLLQYIELLNFHAIVNKCQDEVEITEEILIILKQYFSVTDKEREQTIEHCHKNLKNIESFHLRFPLIRRAQKDIRILTTILKVLGGEK